jgi:hypothetical protein
MGALMRLWSLVVLVGALGLAPAHSGSAADKPTFNRHTGLFEPSFGELERAVSHGDRADVARWAARIGPARLAEALRESDRGRVTAALEAVTLLPGSVRLLDSVTPLVGSADAALAERAVRAVGQMLDAGEPRRMEDWDVPADAVARGCRALADLSQRAGASPDLRLGAIDALADATFSCKPAPLSLLGDAAPAIRRATLLAQRARDELPVSAMQRALADGDPGVVSAAAVAWCRRRLYAGGKGPELTRLPAAPAPGTPPGPALRDLAAAEATPVEDALELLPCLALSGDPADRHALEQLRKSKVLPVKARATELATSGR